MLPGSFQDPEATTMPGQDLTQPSAPEPTPAKPVLEKTVFGVVSIYSATAGDPRSPGTELGVVYPLREGETLFLGKAPAPADLPLEGGESLPITHAHLVTFGEEFEYVSREHLAIEMLDEGRFRVYDYSTNGYFLQETNRHFRRPAQSRPQIDEFEGRDVMVLGIDLTRQSSDRRALDRAQRCLVQIVPLLGGGLASAAETLQ